MSLKAGRKAMNNFNEQYFKIGQPFDAVVYDANTPLLGCTSLQNISSTLIYSTDSQMQLGTIINGNWIVKNKIHLSNLTIKENFIKTMKVLKTR